MGRSIVTRAVDTLRNNGFRAEQACPGRKLPALADIAVAVDLDKVDLDKVDLGEQTATLLVSVVAPSAMGAQACLEAALAVGQLLQENGASCVQGSCEFDGLSNLFCTPITAQYAGTALPGDWTERAGFSLKLGDAELRSLVSFTAKRTAGSGTALADGVWSFEIEEFFRPEDSEDAEPQEPFVIRAFRPLQTETFRDCTWTEQHRVTEQTGTRQIRKGVAGSRSVSIYI